MASSIQLSAKGTGFPASRCATFGSTSSPVKSRYIFATAW